MCIKKNDDFLIREIFCDASATRLLWKTYKNGRNVRNSLWEKCCSNDDRVVQCARYLCNVKIVLLYNIENVIKYFFILTNSDDIYDSKSTNWKAVSEHDNFISMYNITKHLLISEMFMIHNQDFIRYSKDKVV